MALKIDSITPTAIDAVVGEQVVMSCEVSGVSPVGEFSNMILPSATLEVCPVIVASGPDIYVGCGDTDNDDSVYKSTNYGDSWEVYLNGYSTLTSVYAIFIDSAGNVWAGVQRDPVTPRSAIYKNGTLFHDFGTTVSEIFAFSEGVSGRILVGGGGWGSGSGQIFSIDGNTVSHRLNDTSGYRVADILPLSSSVFLSIDIRSRIHKSTDNGETWQYVTTIAGSFQSNTALQWIDSVGIVASLNANSWYLSTDEGSTWSVWEGMPTKYPYSKIRKYGDLILCGSVSDRTVCIRRDGVWEYYTISDVEIDRVFDVAISGSYVFASTGTGAGEGRVYRATAGIAMFELIDTSDNSVLSTVSPYTYTADSADNGKSFQWEVTDGVSTVQSALIPVSVVLMREKPLAGYKAELKMNWVIVDGANDQIVVYDYGQEHDEYTATAEYITNVPEFVRSADNSPLPVTNNAGGFYPFGPHHSADVAGYYYPEYKGKSNLFADWYSWSVKLIPKTDGVYSYVPYNTHTPLGVTGFTFGALVNFPVPEVSPVDEYNIQYNRAGSVVREYARPETMLRRRIRMKWGDLTTEECSVLLSYILTGVRSNIFSVTLPKMMAPWVMRDGESHGSTSVRISDNVVKIENIDGGVWGVEIEVMKS